MSKWTRQADGKTIRRKSLRIQGQFAPRCIDMLESPAYRVLSLAARRLLDRIEIGLAHHGGLENGRLPVTYAQFSVYGIDRLGVSAAIRETVALGFVTVKRGRGGNAEYRQPNVFGLTYRPAQMVRYGDVPPPTDDWRRIKTAKEARQIAQEARGSKFRNHPWKTGPGPHLENRGETEHFPPLENRATGPVEKTGVHLESRGGGGDGDGILPNPAPVQSQDNPGLTASFGREGRARRRTIQVTTTPPSAAPENTRARPSATSASMPKAAPVNGFAASPLRTGAHEADGRGQGTWASSATAHWGDRLD